MDENFSNSAKNTGFRDFRGIAKTNIPRCPSPYTLSVLMRKLLIATVILAIKIV